MSGELFAFTLTTVIVQRLLHRPPNAKLTIFPDTAIAIGNFLLTLLLESEEETGSVRSSPPAIGFRVTLKQCFGAWPDKAAPTISGDAHG